MKYFSIINTRIDFTCTQSTSSPSLLKPRTSVSLPPLPLISSLRSSLHLSFLSSFRMSCLSSSLLFIGHDSHWRGRIVGFARFCRATMHHEPFSNESLFSDCQLTPTRHRCRCKKTPGWRVHLLHVRTKRPNDRYCRANTFNCTPWIVPSFYSLLPSTVLFDYTLDDLRRSEGLLRIKLLAASIQVCINKRVQSVRREKKKKARFMISSLPKNETNETRQRQRGGNVKITLTSARGNRVPLARTL